MAEPASKAVQRKELQSLFMDYNQRYFGGRLPRYKVLLSNTDLQFFADLNGESGRCERRKRKIYINPHKGDASVTLLHEMVHAAVGMGHGKVFLDEVRRLAELGAPLQKELKRYENVVSGITREQLLEEFFELGLSGPDNMTWPEARSRLGLKWGLTDKHGRAKNQDWAAFLRRAHRKWSQGRALATP